MKKPLVLIAILAGLLLSGATPTRSIQGAITPGVATGGGYSLTLEPGCEATVMVGNGYMLVSLATPTASEDGCCCNFMPFTRR